MNRGSLFLVILFSLFWFSEVQSFHRYEISIAVITRDDHFYLEEWIEYHLHAGVDHFYIYDNNENDATKKVLDPYIQQGIVEYFKWPDQPFLSFGLLQIASYQHALKLGRGITKWICFIDTDEFIVPTKYFSLKETLQKEYAEKPLIFVNWKLFGTSFSYLPPPSLTLPFLTKCSKSSFIDNFWGKMIVRPEFLFQIRNMHISPGFVPYVDGSGQLLPFRNVKGVEHAKSKLDLYFPMHDEFLRINHYIFRDEWFWENIKVPRLIFFKRNPEDSYNRNIQYYNDEEDVRILEVIGYIGEKDRP